VNHSLAWYTTTNQTGSSGLVPFHDHRIQSELTGSDAGDIAARTSAHD